MSWRILPELKYKIYIQVKQGVKFYVKLFCVGFPEFSQEKLAYDWEETKRMAIDLRKKLGDCYTPHTNLKPTRIHSLPEPNFLDREPFV